MKSKGKIRAFAAVSLLDTGRRAAQHWRIHNLEVEEKLYSDMVWCCIHLFQTLETFQQEKTDVTGDMGVWNSATLVTAAKSLGW